MNTDSRKRIDQLNLNNNCQLAKYFGRERFKGGCESTFVEDTVHFEVLNLFAVASWTLGHSAVKFRRVLTELQGVYRAQNVA